MLLTLILLFLLWYSGYLIARAEYENRHHRKLKFKDFCNPKNWDKF